MFFSRCPYRGHKAKVARIFLAPIGVTDSEEVNPLTNKQSKEKLTNYRIIERWWMQRDPATESIDHHDRIGYQYYNKERTRAKKAG